MRSQRIGRLRTPPRLGQAPVMAVSGRERRSYLRRVKRGSKRTPPNSGHKAEDRKYKATFHASPPSGASHHPASDHPAPLEATPQPRQSASGAALQAVSRPPEGGGSIAAGRRRTAAVRAGFKRYRTAQ